MPAKIHGYFGFLNFLGYFDRQQRGWHVLQKNQIASFN